MNKEDTVMYYYKQEFDDGNFLLIESTKPIETSFEISEEEYESLIGKIEVTAVSNESQDDSYNEQRLESLQEE